MVAVAFPLVAVFVLTLPFMLLPANLPCCMYLSSFVALVCGTVVDVFVAFFVCFV